jgi:hypothetical protein
MVQILDLAPAISMAVCCMQWIYQHYGGYGEEIEICLPDMERDIQSSYMFCIINLPCLMW